MLTGASVSVPTTTEIDELSVRVRDAYTSGRIPEALELLDAADHRAQDERDRLRLARLRAITLTRTGGYAEALDVLSGVATRWLELGEPHAAVSASSLEAYMCNKLGRLGDALDIAAWTLIILGELDTDGVPAVSPSDPGVVVSSFHAPHVLVATCRNTLGLMFLDLEAVDLAVTEFTRAHDRVGDDDPLLAGFVRVNLASAFLRKALRHRANTGEVIGADVELDRAERLAREILAAEPPLRRQVEAASILATVLHSTHRHGEATAVLEAYADHEDLVDDYRAIADWNLLWARSHRVAGRFDQAMERIDRTLELVRRSGDLVLASLALRERSRLHEVRGNLAAALDDLRTADDEARELRTARFDALVEQLLRRASIEASRQRLEREAEGFGAERLRLVQATETDPLTGVGNRRRLASAVAAVSEGPIRPVSVIMLDIDHFKAANDERGHAFGDRVLTGVAAAITTIAREDDVLCRPGGDEFVMVLPGVVLDAAVLIAERLREGVGRLRWDLSGRRVDGSGGPGVGISVSIGVASGSSVAVDDLIELADAGLLAAKRAGRDGIGVMRSSGPSLLD